jgi:lipoprotein-releasing system permease protein
MQLVLEIAKTHLVSKPKQTIVAMLGVTFGIGMFIAMVSLMTGLNNFTESLTMTSSPDIHIYHDVTEGRPSILMDVNANGINYVHHQKPRKET